MKKFIISIIVVLMFFAQEAKGTIKERRLTNHLSSREELVLTKTNPNEHILESSIPIYARLDLQSVPANAEIWIDDEKIGTTPLFIEQHITGNHKVTIKKTGYKEFSQNITLLEGQTSSLNATLEKRAAFTNKTISEPANCYIIPTSGTYSFKTVKGNSSESVGNVKEAVVLWESFGTTTAPDVGDLVRNVSYADGLITFEASDKKGNALIAAKDAAGTILWSWHIWMTDQPEEQVYYNNAGTMMDRNLGATSATPGDVGALGLLYQWGRKDPFLGASSIRECSQAASTLSWPKAVTSNASNGTVAYALANPTTFIMKNSSNCDWYYTGSISTDDTRWQSSKTIYDPCPPGWKVPDGGINGVWMIASGSSSSFSRYPFDSTSNGMNFSGKLGSSSIIWYPTTGLLYGSTMEFSHVGVVCANWSAMTERVLANSMSFSSSNVDWFNASFRANAISVRCQKEKGNIDNSESALEEYEEEAVPFQLAEEKPSFNGGNGYEFTKWVNSKLVYPETARESRIQGRVTLQFTIKADGTVSNVRVARGVDSLLDKEAVRVVSSSPKWKPGKMNGKPVSVTYTFPVVFQLKEESR